MSRKIKHGTDRQTVNKLNNVSREKGRHRRVPAFYIAGKQGIFSGAYDIYMHRKLCVGVAYGGKKETENPHFTVCRGSGVSVVPDCTGGNMDEQGERGTAEPDGGDSQ